MIVRWLTGALLLVGLGSGANADLVRSQFTVAGWPIYAMNASANSSQFDHCRAQMTQYDGIQMVFAVTRLYDWKLAFSYRDWALTKGTEYDVTFVIDGGQPIVARAIAGHPAMVTMPLAAEGTLFNAFRRGKTLQLAVAGRVYTYPLNGTATMLPALVQCVADQLKTVPAQTARRIPSAMDLFAAPQRTEPVARERTVTDGQDRSAPGRVTRAGSYHDRPEARDGALKAEATVLMANVLSQSGITGFALAAADDAASYDADATWRAGDLMGGLQILPGTPIGDPEVRAIIIGDMARGCKGAFMSGTLPEEGKQVIRMFSSCQDDGTTFTSYFAVIARPKGGIYVFSTVALGEKDAFSSQERVKEADDGLRQAAYRVVK
jgi:hypothetical protein